jgi:hypothetical protein
MGGMKVALALDSGTDIAYRLCAPHEAWVALDRDGARVVKD